MNGKIRDAKPEGYERRSRKMANVEDINIAGYLRFVPGKDLKGAKFDSSFIAAFRFRDRIRVHNGERSSCRSRCQDAVRTTWQA
jgi:hypothetical protein